MWSRFVFAGICGAFVAATGCGGTVREGTGTPSEQLRSDGADRCKKACVTLVACGVGTESCACGCACPVDSPNCACPPCDCGSPKSETPAQCESDCSEAVQKVLDDGSQCDQAILTLLDCLASATCKAGEVPCKAEESALKGCEPSPHATTPPSVTGGTSDLGGSVGPGSITCQGGSGSTAGSGPGSSGPQPGDLVCQNGWDECSDGRSYSVECRATAGSSLACDCLVNGAPESSFTAASCVENTSDADSQCGWHLG